MSILIDAISRRASVVGGGDTRTPQYWLAKMFGGTDTASGEPIDVNSALQCASFFNGVNLLANALKTLPIFVYQRQENGAKRVAREHPAYRILHDRPNPETTPGRFRWWMQACAILWGKGVAEIERDGGGVPINLWPIHPSRVTVKRDMDTNRGLAFDIANDDGTITTLADDDVLHHFGFTRDGITGLDVITVAREALGLSLASEKYTSGFYANSARPDGYIKLPQKLSDEGVERLRKAWSKRHQGVENAHRVGVLEKGAEFVPLGMTHDSAQLVETMRYGVLVIARFLNIPPHKLKDLERATFSNIEHQSLEWVTDSVMPWAVDFEEECTRKLFRAEERDYFAEFNLKAAMRADSASRSQYYREMWNTGSMTINQILALENENPIDSPAGDWRFVPSNMVAIDDDARVIQLSAQTNDGVGRMDRESAEPILQTLLTRACAQLAADDAKALKRELAAGQAKDRAIAGVLSRRKAEIAQVFDAFVPALKSAFGSSPDLAAMYVADRASFVCTTAIASRAELLREYERTSSEQLAKQLWSAITDATKNGLRVP